MDVFVKAVSDHKIIDTLVLEDKPLIANAEYAPPSIAIDFGSLQVRKLCLSGGMHNLGSSERLEQIASNSFIEHLEFGLNEVRDPQEILQNICNEILLPNRGPYQLIINDALDEIDSISDALRQNTSVRSLGIRGLGRELVAFSRALINMAGLRTLSIDASYISLKNIKAMYKALLQSLEQNSNLQTLSLTAPSDSHRHISKQYLPQIRYFLAINRIRRQKLMRETVSSGVWAHVLAKTSDEAVGINYILTARPDIITTTNRKRKNRDDNHL